jgi:hypothetical protein
MKKVAKYNGKDGAYLPACLIVKKELSSSGLLNLYTREFLTG